MAAPWSSRLARTAPSTRATHESHGRQGKARYTRSIEEARRWIAWTEAALERAGHPPALEGLLLIIRGNLADRAGRYDDAIRHFSRAADLLPEGAELAMAAASS